uniref:Uncharacterized protein n=1 Tax=Daphnia galeata TaxID=27404 RepID=A0A8J2W8Q2_9CRUS|nr:unnamed protein product [Daphnia galeata]
MAFDYGAYGRSNLSASSPTDEELDYHYGLSLEEWARDKPLSILQLDPADRAVLRIAGLALKGISSVLVISGYQLSLLRLRPQDEDAERVDYNRVYKEILLSAHFSRNAGLSSI